MTAGATAWGLVMASAASERKTPIPMRVESAVVEACRRGDRNALDQVFRAHAEVLERLLARLVGSTADVEDLLQETFAAAIQAFPRFRGEASIRTWLYSIAVKIALHHLRRARKRRDVPLDEHAAGASTGPSASDAVASQQLAQRLYQHLEHLDPAKRVAFVLHAVDGYSMEEVAAFTGASRAATKSRVFWARRALLKRLRHDPMFAEQVAGRDGGP